MSERIQRTAIVQKHIDLAREASETLGKDAYSASGDFILRNMELLISVEKVAKAKYSNWNLLSPDRRQELLLETAKTLDSQ